MAILQPTAQNQAFADGQKHLKGWVNRDEEGGLAFIKW